MNKFKNQKVLCAALAVSLMGGALPASAGNEDPKPDVSKKLLDPANIDKQVAPGDNFFFYANGDWLKNNPIPKTETRWGSFNELQDLNYKNLRALLDQAAASKAPVGTAEQKVGDFYRTGMDSTRIEKLGVSPMKETFATIDRLKSGDEVLRELAYLHTRGNGQLFSFYVSPDDKKVTEQIAQFFQSGLGMPDRDYYLKDDARSTKIRNAYVPYVAQMLQLSGLPKEVAMKGAQDIFSFEKQIAEISMSRVEMRDPYKTYNKFDIATLSRKTPGFDWKALLGMLKIGNVDSVIVGQPEFFAFVGRQLKETPLDTWKMYLRFHTLNDAAPYLSSNVGDARFDFYGKTLRGQQEQTPRWKRMLNTVDGTVGELLGEMYVKKHFQPEAREKMLALVNNLQESYSEHINKLDWMSTETKKRAQQKLGTFLKKIGYPNKWKDYSKLQVSPTDFFQNVEAASAFEYQYNVGKLGRPVDRNEWGMTPPTVNAYYNPAFNEIVFPAGILQYPFYDAKADDAVNYGGIGSVIGHEMTHGFDDQGRQYDAFGNLKDWWTASDAEQFTKKANVVVKQFNNFKVLDTVSVNGELTLGENLADLGGLAISYDAFQKTRQAKEGKKIDGFTPDQRFFLSWAQVWRANTRPEEMASRIVTDPHAPNELRTNAPLSNMEAWYKAFDIKPGAKMYLAPADRAKVW